MLKLKMMACLLGVTVLFTTGCWDREELTDRAFVMAAGVDELDDGRIAEAVQIAVPTQLGAGQGGTKGKMEFQVIEGVGRTVEEAVDNIQAKSSRKIFGGHRRAIFIGERLARHGLQQVLDQFSRNPEMRLRTDVFVVKGDEARRLIQENYPLERVPAQAAMKIHNVLGGYLGDQSLAQFLMDKASDSNCPTLPLISHYEFVGRAVFNRNLRMVGELNTTESIARFWVVNLLRRKLLTTYVPEGHGYVSLNLTKLQSRIRPEFRSGKLHFHISLTGAGTIVENGTRLDVLKDRDLAVIEHRLEALQRQRVENVIAKVQRDDRTDIFNFGQTIHRRYPYQWKRIKGRWDQLFPEAGVDVSVHLRMNQTGLTGKPLQLAR